MAKMQEYRDQSVQELQIMHEELSKALFQLRNEAKSGGRLEQPHLVAQTRRNIARVLTALREKQQQAAGV